MRQLGHDTTESGMPEISAVIITFNEEKNIARCLESLTRVADEILVVDSFSQDATETICRSYGVRFIQHRFEGHIEQKNYAVSQARHDYILSLDADEALTDELARSIEGVKQDWRHDGHALSRLTCYCGQWIRHCGWYPDRKIRLFDRRRARWGGVNPHDKIIMSPGATTVPLKGDLLHYTFYSITQHHAQIEKFSEIKAEGLFRRGKRPSLFLLVMEPVFKFMKSYVLQAGFLDGWYGLIISVNSAHSTFLKNAKLYEKTRRARDDT